MMTLIKTILFTLTFISVAHAEIPTGNFKGTGSDGYPCELTIWVKDGVKQLKGFKTYTNFGTEKPILVPATFDTVLVFGCHDENRNPIWCGMNGGGYGERIFLKLDSNDRPIEAKFSKQAYPPNFTCTLNQK
jgi:hypothetical protein